VILPLADTTATDYGAERFWGAVITVAVMVVVSGFLVPWVAGLVARRIHPEKITDPAKQAAAEQRKARWTTQHEKSPWNVLLGHDGRLSTSKAVAYAWTAVVVYVLAVLILEWPDDWGTALKNLSPTYLLLLGGPYASLVLSKAIVSTRTSSGSLTKPEGSGDARLSDLIADDTGRTDLFDVQFVAFNVLALWFVVTAFLRATPEGFPDIPSGLVILTGGPAAVYLSNKLFSSTTATVSAVTPSKVLEGEDFFVVGSGFMSGYAKGLGVPFEGKVEVGGVLAPTVEDNWTDTRVRATAPRGDGGEAPVRVTVVGPGGVTATLDGALTVRSRPAIESIDASVARGGTLKVVVDWPAGTPSGSPVVVHLGADAISGLTSQGPGSQLLQVPVPAGLTAGEKVMVTVRGPGAASQAKSVEVT
jgi:hypothetical protein